MLLDVVTNQVVYKLFGQFLAKVKQNRRDSDPLKEEATG